MKKKLLCAAVMTLLAISPLSVFGEQAITEIPLTESVEKPYDTSFLSVTGFAEGMVNDRSEYLNTDAHRVVHTEYEFIKALDDAQTGDVKIIEVAEDLDLGLGNLDEETMSLKSISEYGWKLNAELHNPSIMMVDDVTKVLISNTNGLTIFSRSGATIRHAEWKVQGSARDIVIRNLKFDGMWHWTDNTDASVSQWEAGWSLMKVNGGKGVWIDHCTFTLGADGLCDMENGGTGVTYSWCEFSLETTKTPDKQDDFYKSMMYMEAMYQLGRADKDGRYYIIREGGVSAEDLLAYEAHHSKAFMIGSGDQDFTDSDSTTLDGQNGNQRLRLTYAYNKINSVGQRYLRMRQGVGHMYNCYADTMEHMKLHSSSKVLQQYGHHSFNRCINVHVGGSVAADTCVFYGYDTPIIGSEIEGGDTPFKNAYNHVLIVNSKMTKVDGTEYVGSSWDNDGENLFTAGMTWNDKSTIGKWSWYSKIVNAEQYTRGEYPEEPFVMEYDYETGLPYSYQKFPLEDVEEVVKTHSGAYTYSQEPAFWVRTEYEANENFAPVAAGTVVNTEEVRVAEKSLRVSMDEVTQIQAEVYPSHSTEDELTYTVEDESVLEVWDSGLVIPKGIGKTTVTVTSEDDISNTVDVEVYQKITRITLKSRSKKMETGTVAKIGYTIQPEDATYKDVKWSSSDMNVVAVDVEGNIYALNAGKCVITCTSVDNPEMKATCTITVTGNPATPPPTATPNPNPDATPTPMPSETALPTPTPEPALKGDVDDNGIINASDALAVLEHAANITPITEERAVTAADINEDGIINAADALKILNIAAGIMELPTEEKYLLVKQTSEGTVTTHNYDKYGNVVSSVETTTIDEEVYEVVTTNKHSYNTKGWLVKTVSTMSDDTGTYVTENRFTYDDRGNLIRNEVDVDGVETYELYEMSYNEDGLLTKAVLIINDILGITMKEESLFVYDSNDLMTEMFMNLYIDNTHLVEMITTMQYGEEGQPLKGIIEVRALDASYDVVEGESRTVDYVYDEQLNCTSMITKTENGIEVTVNYHYDEFGNVTRQITSTTMDGETDTEDVSFEYEKVEVSVPIL